jgi:hypothetical protein
MRGGILVFRLPFFPEYIATRLIEILDSGRSPGMNVGRGLFRVLVVVSLIWISGALALAVSDFPGSAANWKYQAVRNMRSDINLRDVDWSHPYYEWVRSWSKEGIAPEFVEAEPQFVADWNEEARFGRMQIQSFPDRSRLYLDAQITDDDKAYLKEHFWAERWRRRAKFAGERLIIALAPVAALFIAGYVLLWVARGFARQ